MVLSVSSNVHKLITGAFGLWSSYFKKYPIDPLTVYV